MPNTVDLTRLCVPVTADVSDLKGKLRNAADSIGTFGQAIQTVAGIARGAFRVMAVSAGVATTAMAGLVSSSTLTAGRVQEMNQVLYLMGRRMGMTKGEIDDTIGSMKELGIRTDVAQRTLAIFARNQLDLAKATKVARTAQNLAILTASDSSDTLAELTYAIRTQNTDLNAMREIGVRAGRAMRKYGDEIGKLPKELTQAERQQAVLNAIIEKGKNLTGLYETAQENASKAMRSLRRHFYEARVEIGKHFLPAFSDVINLITVNIKGIRELLEEGKSLSRIFGAMGRAASAVTTFFTRLGISTERLNEMLSGVADVAEVLAFMLDESLGQMGDEAIQSVRDTIGRWTNQMIEWAEVTFKWGVKIASELAQGIIRGASTALVTAMNFISNLLSNWLRPSSPPAVVPHLDEWGIETASIFLRGFSKVDFRILDGFRSQFSAALQTLVSMGKIGEQEAAERLSSVSESFVKSIAIFRQTGSVPAQLFDRIREAGGKLGGELSTLAKRYFQLMAAQKRLRQAQERVTEAHKQEEKAQGELSDLIAEYNKMQREGATQAELRAKREEIEAAKDRVRAAHDETEAAEEQRDKAKESIDPIKERLALQKQLIRQLTELFDVQKQIADEISAPEVPGADGAGAGDGILPDEYTSPEIKPEIEKPDTEDIAQSLSEAQQRIKKAIEDALAPLKETIKEWKRRVGEVRQAFNRLKGTIAGLADDPRIQGLKQWFRDTFGETTLADLVSFWTQIGLIIAAFGILAGVVGLVTSPLFLLIATLTLLKVAWDNNWGDIQGRAQETKGVITGIVIPAITDSLDDLKRELGGMGERMSGLGAIIQSSWKFIKRTFRAALRIISGLIVAFIFFIMDDFDGFSRAMQGVVKEMWGVITDWFETSLETVRKVFGVDLERLVKLVGYKLRNLRVRMQYQWLRIKWFAIDTWKAIKEGVQEQFDAFLESGKSTMNTFKTVWDETIGAIADAAKKFWEWLTGRVFSFNISIPSVPDWFKSWVQTQSPTLEIHEAYKKFWTDLRRHDQDMGQMIKEAVPPTVAMATAPVGRGMMAAGAGAQQVMIKNEFGIGSVRSDHDLYRLAEEISRSLDRRRLRRNIR